MDNPEGCFDKFEQISMLVKQTKLAFKDPKDDHQERMYDVPEQPIWVQEMNLDHNKRFKNLMNGINPVIRSEDRHLLENEKDRIFKIPNFMEERELLKWAGVDFGMKDTFKL